MGDGYCDDSLSIDYCGLDFGDCGYCAYGCNFNLGFKDMLGGFCDNECNTESCLFDMGACTSPFTTCTETLLGNGVCDLECDSDSYNFDNGDCYYKTCADGCFNYMVGDSYCQPQCRVEACNYDMMDCDCSPGCFSELRADGKCDPLCDFLVCKWDQGDCGDCNSGCFTEMLGNGICDSQCNNEACDYDIKDCSCTTSCTSIIYGQCDFNCLVPACLYDQISSDPLKRCLDSDKVMLAVRTHRLMGDYSPVSLSYCTFYVESCDYESMVQTEICLSVCDFLYCPNNYYTCRSTNICDFPGCKICDD